MLAKKKTWDDKISLGLRQKGRRGETNHCTVSGRVRRRKSVVQGATRQQKMVGWAIMALCDTTSWSYAGVASELVTGACSSIIGGPGDISGSRGWSGMKAHCSLIISFWRR